MAKHRTTAISKFITLFLASINAPALDTLLVKGATAFPVARRDGDGLGLPADVVGLLLVSVNGKTSSSFGALSLMTLPILVALDSLLKKGEVFSTASPISPLLLHFSTLRDGDGAGLPDIVRLPLVCVNGEASADLGDG